MKKSQRLKTIVEIKAAQEKSALEALGAAQRKLQEMQAQVDSLKNYRLDYQVKFEQLGRAGTPVAQLLEFRAFMDKLDKAIAGQEMAQNECETRLMAKRKHWEGLHYRTQSLQKVCDSARAVELKQEDRREQLEQDERACRSGRNNSASRGNI